MNDDQAKGDARMAPIESRNGCSSYELARGLGVTQKTAWYMLHRIRLAMKDDDTTRFGGEVEADETFVGGKARNQRGNVGARQKAGTTSTKAVVFGMIERGGRVRAQVVKNNRRSTLLPKLLHNVASGTTLYTDALPSYADAPLWYRHEVINHAEAYVRGHVHTNSIENFWSCVKRTLGGTYISVRAFHLDAYLAEQVFRFNARAEKDGARFVATAKGADGHRLTYKALTSSHPRWRSSYHVQAARRPAHIFETRL
jgi:transposase-like protein